MHNKQSRRENTQAKCLTLVLFLIMLFNPTAFAKPVKLTPHTTRTIEVAKALGWIEQPKQSVCGGYYLNLYEQYHIPSELMADDVVDIKSDQGHFAPAGYSWLKGHVQIRQGQRYLNSQMAKLWRTKKTGDITHIHLTGPIILAEPTLLVIAKQASLHWNQGTGTMEKVLYRLSRTKTKQLVNPITAWGTALVLKRPKPMIYRLDYATYTTCPPMHNSWQIAARKLQMNRDTGRGHASHIVLRTHGFPIFYFPYFNFPIDKRRMSGFLYPTFSHSNQSGYSITFPYYLNLAPNYDLTFMPALLSKRGTQLNLETRYLTTHHKGTIHAHTLPSDRTFANFKNHATVDFMGAVGLNRLTNASSTRKLFSFEHRSEFNAHWSGQADYNYVSDDYYLQDFGGSPNATTANQLLRQAKINYTSQYLHIVGLAQSYETLHPINQTPIDNVYSREPLLRAEGQLPSQPLGIITNLLTEWTNFHHSSDLGVFTDLPFPTGDRLHAMIDLQRPWYSFTGFINPRIRWLRTQYKLNSNLINARQLITRSLPIISLDSGLFLQRTFNSDHQTFHQTLEPRLFYLYSPNRNQSHIPVFDTASQPFTFDHMFSFNRFSGVDRIADANQFAVAITTRLFEETTGFERLWASIGTTYYLRNRQVTLCQTTGCSDTRLELGANSSDDSLSPLVAALNYAFDGTWQAHTEIAWSPSGRITNNGNFNLQYHPDNHHIMNLGYTYIRNGDILIFNTHKNPKLGSARNNLNQGSIDGVWPIAKQWHGMVHWTYNISHRHSQLYLYGLQYESCCWAFRFMASHNFKGLNQTDRKLYTNSVYIQWLFKGLGRVGTSPNNILDHVIDGYHDFFGDQT